MIEINVIYTGALEMNGVGFEYARVINDTNDLFCVSNCDRLTLEDLIEGIQQITGDALPEFYNYEVGFYFSGRDLLADMDISEPAADKFLDKLNDFMFSTFSFNLLERKK